jgi:hypothetical protein
VSHGASRKTADFVPSWGKVASRAGLGLAAAAQAPARVSAGRRGSAGRFVTRKLPQCYSVAVFCERAVR